MYIKAFEGICCLTSHLNNVTSCDAMDACPLGIKKFKRISKKILPPGHLQPSQSKMQKLEGIVGCSHPSIVNATLSIYPKVNRHHAFSPHKP